MNEKYYSFLYSKYLIVSKTKKKLDKKAIYEVKLEGKDNLHERGNISSVSLTREEIYSSYDISEKK